MGCSLQQRAHFVFSNVLGKYCHFHCKAQSDECRKHMAGRVTSSETVKEGCVLESSEATRLDKCWERVGEGGQWGGGGAAHGVQGEP